MIIYVKDSHCARWYKIPVVKVIIIVYEMELFNRETLNFFLTWERIRNDYFFSVMPRPKYKQFRIMEKYL